MSEDDARKLGCMTAVIVGTLIGCATAIWLLSIYAQGFTH